MQHNNDIEQLRNADLAQYHYGETKYCDVTKLNHSIGHNLTTGLLPDLKTKHTTERRRG